MPSTSVRNTFTKEERLKSRKLIAELFGRGRQTVIPPFRLLWMTASLPTASPAQIGFSVPVKNFRNAVDRNRIKRQMREVYRKNKAALYSLIVVEKKQCAMMLVFTGKTTLPFDEIEHKLTLTLSRFEEDFKQHVQ